MSAPTEMEYLLHFANQHVDFRVAELLSLADLFSIEIPEENLRNHNKKCPFLILRFQNESEASKLASRSVLIKSVVELWGHGNTYKELYQDLKHSQCKHLMEPYFKESISYKIIVEAYNRKLSQVNKIKRIEDLPEDIFAFKGKIRLKDPDVKFFLIEDYGEQQSSYSPDEPYHIYFGRWVGDGSRDEIQKQHLTKRCFLGNTSMDSGLSLLMTNISKVDRNMLVYDPFVGTGSLLVPCAHYGAYVLGSDINYLLLHAKAKPSRHKQKKRSSEESIRSNLAQYGLESFYCDIIVSDSSKHDIWKPTEIFDAIITDPPYGIREGAKKVGHDKLEMVELSEDQKVDHIPQRVEYELSSIFSDLLDFAYKYLRLHGRLTYWLPVYRPEYKEENVPQHPCMKLISNCEQILNLRIARRLITMEKCREFEICNEQTSQPSIDHYSNATFRQMYFQATALTAETNHKEKGNPCHQTACTTDTNNKERLDSIHQESSSVVNSEVSEQNDSVQEVSQRSKSTIKDG